MFFFPFVDMIEKAIAWAKGYASRIYWVWVIVIAIFCAISGWTWADGGDLPRYSLIIAVGIWWVGAWPMYLHEKKHNKKCTTK